MIDEDKWKRELYLETNEDVDYFVSTMWAGRDITGKAILWYSCDTILERVFKDYKKLLARAGK